MIKRLLCTYSLLLPFIYCMAQGIYFTAPLKIDPVAGNNPIRIARQDQKVCFAWQEASASGEIHIAWYDLAIGTMQAPVVMSGAIGRPVFCHAAKKLYLLWNDEKGNIRYAIISGGQTGKAAILPNSQSFKILSASGTDGRILLSVANSDRKNASILVVHEGADKALVLDKSFDIPDSRHIEYCSAIPEGTETLKVFWKAQKHKNLLYTNFNLNDQAMGKPSGTIISTDVFQVADVIPLNDPDSQLLLWKRSDKENKWYYGIINRGTLHDEHAQLPYLGNTTEAPVIDRDENGNFHIGANEQGKQFLLGSFSLYDPAHWISDFLLPQKSNYTLKDIVIPGSHDAGMSVLKAAGGKDAGIINECNTLTQLHDINGQLRSGIRMFDLRLDMFQGELYTKHAPSDCMEDAVAGGYGEKLSDALQSVKRFLKENNGEFVILSFCHFCDKHIPIAQQADSIVHWLGKDLLFEGNGKSLKDLTLNALSGKVLVTFENYTFPEKNILLNTLARQSTAPVNYKRAYAASNDLGKLLTAQQSFFIALKDSLYDNDLVRIDWQLTEAGQEAAFICNDFQSPKSNPLLDGAKLLLNTVKNNKSIIELALTGNQVFTDNVNAWISKGIINTHNHPNILYVDVSGNWITDYCVLLNAQPIYSNQK
ncbi:MAG: hypothetical protein JWR09_1090 [Mucilaginibacter sp.]|nr:hypothetical protein [Mucilaginibacter sp.]